VAVEHRLDHCADIGVAGVRRGDLGDQARGGVARRGGAAGLPHPVDGCDDLAQ
jgi:hypothetical protein